MSATSPPMSAYIGPSASYLSVPILFVFPLIGE
jgi:hypothetical protein